MSNDFILGAVCTDEPGTIEETLYMSSAAPTSYHASDSTVPSQRQNVQYSQSWSAEEWSEKILGQQPVRASHIKLQKRVNEFLVHASAQEKNELEQSRQQLLEMIQDAKAAGKNTHPDSRDASLRTKFRQAWSSTSQMAYQYSQMLDPMIGQAPGYVSLAYGAIKIILTVQMNYQELKEKVKQYLDQIAAKFELTDHLTAYIPTKQLVDHFAQAYHLFTKFLSKAVKYYTQSRVKTYLKAITRPWDRFQQLVDAIGQTFVVIEKIAQFHGLLTAHANMEVSQQTLALLRNQDKKFDASKDMLENVLSQLHAISVHFTKEEDIRETASLVREHVDQIQDDPILSKGSASEPDIDHAENSQINILDQLGGPFSHLKSYNQETLRRKGAIEETPEMRSHRSTQRNLLRSEKVLAWIESDVSQILWVEGNNVLRRSDFNASFAIPLLVMGEGNYESTLILRHFCGDIGMARKPSTLIQALLYQVVERNPHIPRKSKDIFTQENTLSNQALWGLLIECLDEVSPDCTFIIIDSFDKLEQGEPDEEGEIITYLDNLVKDKSRCVKVLLTASLASPLPTLPDEYHSLVIQRSPYRGVQRSLSTVVMESQSHFISHQLVEIQEKRCKAVRFHETPFLYPAGSMIYHKEGDSWRAFTVTELSGMNPEPFGKFTPLVIRAWSVDHNGKYFAKSYHDLTVHQFSGTRTITSLKFIPAGFLPEEGIVRKELIRRGRKYWQLASSVNYKQLGKEDGPVRVIIDQQIRPLGKPPAQEFTEQFRLSPASDLRPQALIACQPVIDVYLLSELRWSVVEIDEIQEVMTDESRSFDNLLLNVGNKAILRSLVWAQEASDRVLGSGIERPVVKGTTVLLHGPPGCGKTFSVECLAETVRRPLLHLTHASLGESIRDLVDSLGEAFRLSDRWGCIVLIDDVKSFLSPRKDDISQNINITLFMQLTEKHSGLLFLTINQFGALDTALLSRIQVTLYYPEFTFVMVNQMLQQRLRIIGERARKDKGRIEIDTVDIIQRVEHMQKSGLLTLSGRDILNLCETALILANHETHGDRSERVDSVPMLNARHFETVIRMRGDYQRYIADTQGSLPG
ncbi:hypothetical protein BO79DRAFT_268248 [Aspergillus costaricaensis CBS 115574]|uniref:Uncharacterized protein n=1 Tax=Aspergillus costaricaensis CBS 115574 TaxID=1448317 RepID=A0ACD1ITG4_9EURO|nr:hypothetical protein BO79DRAFT_268248 [Aspergillus costaricaensis CBS 115574]RAK93828.1 hypothetical protein BO79DRAFT_268248 [Aspergillus costaricaensis CBS 115574]